MKRELKVGDRVAVYGLIHDGELKPLRKTGIIENIREDGLLSVHSPHEVPFLIHSKQCRHLVKKHRREWWIATHPCSIASVHAQYKPEMVCGNGCKIEWYRVREVKERK